MSITGKVIRHIRREKGISQTALAKLSGVNQPNISRIESGFVENPQLETLHRICAALDIGERVVLNPSQELLARIAAISPPCSCGNPSRVLIALKRLLEIHCDPCHFDHHGNCQAHFVENPCSIKLAREAVAEVESK